MNRMLEIKKLPACLLFLAAVAIVFSAGPVSAFTETGQGPDGLLRTYHRTRTRLETNSFGLPLSVESVERDDRVHVDVYGIFDFPFNSVVNGLKVPATWCDIVSLHPNIKACTFKELQGEWLLTFYPGKKSYQAPEDTRPVTYHYRVVNQQQGYLDIGLSADAGPFGTKDHNMRFEALPLGRNRTYVHVSYAYSDSLALRLATKMYFATLGLGKVGFTETGRDRNGYPVYIGGPRGALERSAVRYYFAIQSVMNTMRYPEESRFSMRLSEWFDLTSRYRRQLFDLDRQDYLTFKSSEHRNQTEIQRRVGTEVRQ